MSFVIDKCPPQMIHCNQQFQTDKGADGEKYRRRSVPVSGGECEPRTKNLREEHSVAAI